MVTDVGLLAYFKLSGFFAANVEKLRTLVGERSLSYVAATLAGVFHLDDALALVAERGRLLAVMDATSITAIRTAAAISAEVPSASGPSRSSSGSTTRCARRAVLGTSTERESATG